MKVKVCIQGKNRRYGRVVMAHATTIATVGGIVFMLVRLGFVRFTGMVKHNANR